MYKPVLLGSLFALALLGSAAQAQVFNFDMSSDNDMALYVGNADGTQLRQVVDKATGWGIVESGGFTLLPGEDFFYLLSMNYGGPGDVGGLLNGVSITDIPGWLGKDVPTASLSGFPVGIDETFNPVLSDVQSIIAAGNFNTAPTIGSGTVGFLFNGQSFVTETSSTASSSATMFRQSIAAAAAPEPGSVALLALGAPVLLRLRRRNA